MEKAAHIAVVAANMAAAAAKRKIIVGGTSVVLHSKYVSAGEGRFVRRFRLRHVLIPALPRTLMLRSAFPRAHCSASC